jgi:hypothetical protein
MYAVFAAGAAAGAAATRPGTKAAANETGGGIACFAYKRYRLQGLNTNSCSHAAHMFIALYLQTEVLQ